MSQFHDLDKVKQLKQLWKEVFGDTEEYLQLFFSEIYQEENTCTYVEDGKIKAMLYMIPYKLYVGKNEYDVWYLYALATNSANRKQGIMTDLIQQANDIAGKRGAIGTFLQPAKEALYSYYKERGYTIRLEKFCLEMTGEEIETVKRMERGNERSEQQELPFSVKKIDICQYMAVKYGEYRYGEYRYGMVTAKKNEFFYYQELLMDGAECIAVDYDKDRCYFILKNDIEMSRLTICSEKAVDFKKIIGLLYGMKQHYNLKSIVWESFDGINKDVPSLLKTYIKTKRGLMIRNINGKNGIDWDKVNFQCVLY